MRKIARRTWWLYDDQNTRSGRCPAECLAGYTSYLQVDGDAGYHSTEAKRVGCIAHARRKFEEARRTPPNANVGNVVWALSLIQKLKTFTGDGHQHRCR